MTLESVDIGSRVLKNAVVLSISANAVSFRDGQWVVNVEFPNLPPDIRARLNTRPKAAPITPPPSKPATVTKRPPNNSSPPNPPPSSPAPVNLDSARSFAQRDARRYFYDEYSAGSGYTYGYGIVIKDVSEVAGWTDHFRATGTVQVEQYDGNSSMNKRSFGFELTFKQNGQSGFERISIDIR